MAIHQLHKEKDQLELRNSHLMHEAQHSVLWHLVEINNMAQDMAKLQQQLTRANDLLPSSWSDGI